MNEKSRTHPHQPMRRRRFLQLAGIGSLASGLLAACSPERTDGDEPDADGATDDELAAEADDDLLADVRENFEPFDSQELDLETLEVEFPNGPTAAEPWDNTWVGQVTDDLFIGIRIADPNGDAPREVTAYLCDNEFWAVLDGELVDDAATLSDEGTVVGLELIGDEVTGSVTLADQNPIDFSAEPATGDAGVYVASTELDEVEVTGRWIVLKDGQQRGTEICCSFACCPPIGACWPCREQL